MSGPHIPGYEYVERIGGGGFAEVFCYEQQWPRQRVAVKVVRRDLSLSDREKQLFTAEADAMAQLADHPYIVSVITAGVTEPDGADPGGRPYLVMRYCPPPDLGVRVRQQPMSVPDALSTGIKLASAIETAHRAGILHRDIKPSNVLVTTYNEPALTDFGIAGRVQDVAADSEVRISYPWAPPELLDGSSNGHVTSDVYSLGATIWNLLVGRSPFAIPNGDNSPRALTTRILHAAPSMTHRPDVPPALERLLQQCLAKQPEHRPNSALELARALQRIEAQAGYSRTQIAVEGPSATTSSTPDAAADDPDETHVKPISVVSASGPRLAVPMAPGGPVGSVAGDTPASSDRDGQAWLWWTTAAAVVVAAFLVVLAFRVAGGEREPEADPPPPTATRTPLEVAPGAPERAPILEASRRADGQAVFRWEPDGPPAAGDSWQWTREDTGETTRTEDQRLVVGTTDRVCLSVVLVRGAYPSVPARTCADPAG